jgi:hypothetical protein
MAVTVSRSGAMPQCCSMPDRISHNIQRGRQLAAALGGLWRSGSLANYYWLQFKSRSKKRGGSKRIKRIRAPSASFRGSTRCDQHGPLSCERAGLRLLFGSSWCACGAVRLALLLSDPRVLLASRMPLRGCAASTRFSRSPIRCPSPSEAHAVESGSWQIALVRSQGTCECPRPRRRSSSGAVRFALRCLLRSSSIRRLFHPLPSVREWSRQRAAFLRSPFLRIGDLVAAAPRLVFRSQTALELLSAPSEMPTDRLCTPFTAVQHEDDILGSVTTNLWICASEHVLWWCRDVSVGVNDGTDRLLPY